MALAVTTLIGTATLVGFAVTWKSGGLNAFVQAVAKSGFAAAFALIFVSEIGDKVSHWLVEGKTYLKKKRAHGLSISFL